MKREKIYRRFYLMLKMLMNKYSKRKYSDSLGYLQQEDVDKDQKLNVVTNNIKIIINILKQIRDHDFNQNDYSTEIYLQTRQSLKENIKEDQKIIKSLQFLLQFTSLDNQFIQSGSNSLNLLIERKIDLTKKSFENIKIKNTSLIGANFVRCNLSGSYFENVCISRMNLNGAQLFN
ncbi:unnamed protein product [Paramecium pentaurelia]|uniref:Pentapeptide repeat-containing protein n=1 Tax=Paramecium pentaurelia TaxID=43138 RepID=A0A8S1V8N7_9CILI|nr:unnamed protein product [Paramecium pentaurelia]